MCAALGLEAVVGESATARTGYLAGVDTARAADLQRSIDDPGIDAIWALRGGYGTVRLLPHVNFDAMRTRPKAYIGFSDNTSIHLALARLGVVSFHAPHAGGDFPPFAETWFRRILFDGASAVALDVPEGAPLDVWRGGVAEGRLIGGNLALLAAAEGTSNAIASDGVVLFLEDIGEPPYRIDRLLTQLAMSGVLAGVAGVVVGQFTDCSDATADGLDVVRGQLADLAIPIVANAPIGHVPDNWTVPVGVRVRLDADAGNISLLEPAVS